MSMVLQWGVKLSNMKKLLAVVSTVIKQQILYHEVTGDIICPSMVQGIDHIRDPRLNKVIVEIIKNKKIRI